MKKLLAIFVMLFLVSCGASETPVVENEIDVVAPIEDNVPVEQPIMDDTTVDDTIQVEQPAMDDTTIDSNTVNDTEVVPMDTTGQEVQ